MTREDGPHLILYDGGCGLCHGFVRFVLARDPGGRFHFASLQGPVAARYLEGFGGDPRRLETVCLVVNYQQGNPEHWVKARAVLRILAGLGGVWRLIARLRVLPVVGLDRAYDVVARNRHWFLGRRESCLVPRPEFRNRFPDLNPTIEAGKPGAG